VLVAAVMAFIGDSALAQPPIELWTPYNLRQAIEMTDFTSKADAEAYLRRMLPIATADNPKYRSPGSDVETRWITKSIAFESPPGGGAPIVSMIEEILEYTNGAVGPPGAHTARFSMQDMNVTLRTDSTDVTDKGEKAIGIIFNCKAGPCVDSNYKGDVSKAPWTDIYIQDKDTRESILKAFQLLAAP
jgi:hypothetical protein